MLEWKRTTEEQRQKIAELFNNILINNHKLHPSNMPRTTYVLYKIHEKGYFIDLSEIKDIVKRMSKNIDDNKTSGTVSEYLQDTCYSLYFYFTFVRINFKPSELVDANKQIDKLGLD